MPSIRVGIGGWTFPPWRGVFYPPGLPHARELAYASEHLTTIEINGTFYGAQKPESFARWRAETPDGFVFSVKAARATTHRKDPAEIEASVHRFLGSGVTELGEKLGPILWQFPPTRQFDAQAFEGFLALLPNALDGVPLRHVVEARHSSFDDPAAIALLRRFGVARAMIDSDKQHLLGDQTADFVYARLQRSQEAQPDGYPPDALDLWAGRFRAWSRGDAVTDLPLVDAAAAPAPRDCYVYFISGDKVRAPAAAMAMLGRVGG